MRVQLKPGLRTVWRGPGSVQIGLSSSRGTVIDGLTAADSRVIERLRDGTSAGTARQHRLIELLDDAGVLLLAPPQAQAPAAAPPSAESPAGAESRAGAMSTGATSTGPATARLEPDAALWSVVHPGAADGWPLLSARADRRVLISGAGRLGGTLASTLAAAGVGQVCLLDPGRVGPSDLTPAAAQPADLGRIRQDATADAVVRAGGRASTTDSLARQQADVTVLIEYGAADTAAADVLVAADIPHLSIVVRDDDVVVGPLVRPGSGPCLRCLDLHRSDRDPAWPSMLAQLLGRAGPGQGEESASAVLAAGLAALQVLAQLDGLSEPAAAGATLEVELPDGLTARRAWPAHPGCGCHWPPRIADRQQPPDGSDHLQPVQPVHSGQPGGPSGADGRRMTT